MMNQPQGKQITGIGFRAKIVGQGVVNFDGAPGKYHAPVKSSNDNIKCAKTAISYFSDEDGQIVLDEQGRPRQKFRQAKISSNCLRNALFRQEHPGQSSSILAGLKQDNLTLLIASYSAIVRGYLYAVKNNNIKRKSPLMITDALQSNDQVLKIETCTSSGARSETSLFEQDNIGNVTYESKGYLDLSEMSFVSCDIALDRPAFAEDYWELYRNCLEKKYGTKIQKDLEFYTKKTAEIPISEKGFLLNPDLISEFAVRFFESLQNLYISRANAYAKVSEVEVFFKTVDDLSFDFDAEPSMVFKRGDEIKDQLNSVFTSNDLVSLYRPSEESEVELTKSYLERLKSEMTKKADEKVKKAEKQKKVKKS